MGVYIDRRGDKAEGTGAPNRDMPRLKATKRNPN